MFWKCDEKGVFSLWNGEDIVLTGYAAAEEKDLRRIDTRKDRFTGKTETE